MEGGGRWVGFGRGRGPVRRGDAGRAEGGGTAGAARAPRRPERNYSRTRMTTRRFCARPSRVLLSPTGCEEPKEMTDIA